MKHSKLILIVCSLYPAIGTTNFESQFCNRNIISSDESSNSKNGHHYYSWKTLSHSNESHRLASNRFYAGNLLSSSSTRLVVCFVPVVATRPEQVKRPTDINIFFTPLSPFRDSCTNVFSSHSSRISKESRQTEESSTSKTRSQKLSKKTRKLKNIGRQRMSKSEIDDLVKGIGLVPVASTSSKLLGKQTFTKRKNPSHQKLSIEEQNQETTIDSTYPNSFPILTQKSSPLISLQTQLDYARNGHAALRSFLPSNLINQLRSELIPYARSHALTAWRQKVEVQLADSPDDYHHQNARSIADSIQSIKDCQDLLESLGMDPTSDLPFLQHFNSWRSKEPNTVKSNKSNPLLPTVTSLCLSPYLAQTASVLLHNSPTVRLYQDSLFHKRSGDGWTPWHSDARMAPFDTSKMITFWIPLQRVPSPEEGGTGLLFVDGSHSDFALPYWNGLEGREYDRLEERYSGSIKDRAKGVSHHMPLEVGDVTVHSGWTLHCADATDFMKEGEDRYALAVTYVDGCAEIREDVVSGKRGMRKEAVINGGKDEGNEKGNKEDAWSFRPWVDDVEPRSQFLHPLVPIVWPLDQRDN